MPQETIPWSCPLQTTGPPESPYGDKGYRLSANIFSINNKPDVSENTEILESAAGLFSHRNSTIIISDYHSRLDASVPYFSLA